MKYLILILALTGCVISKKVTKEPQSYVSKTYIYSGNTFEEKFNSKIDTLNYTWRDSFQNNRLVSREYPKYQGNIHRTEKYAYDDDGELKEEVVTMIYPQQRTISDTIQYIKIDSNTTETVRLKKGKKIVMAVRKTINDTTYIDRMVGGKYGFTSREYWETATRKNDRIIRPTPSKIVNVYLYNENGDLTGIERTEEGSPPEKTMMINYRYDARNRVILKDTYYGEGENMTLGSKEITVYE